MTDAQDDDPWGTLRQHWTENAQRERNDPNRRATYLETPYVDQIRLAIEQLKAQGWQEMRTCPHDTEVRMLAVGSVGVCPGVLRADGGCWLMEAGDLWPAQPLLWKPLLPRT